MLDKRFLGEENLAKKLEQYDGSNNLQDLPSFESVFVHSPKKFPLWFILKGLGLCLVVGLATFLFLPESGSDSDLVGLIEDQNNVKGVNTINSSREESIAPLITEAVPIAESIIIKLDETEIISNGISESKYNAGGSFSHNSTVDSHNIQNNEVLSIASNEFLNSRNEEVNSEILGGKEDRANNLYNERASESENLLSRGLLENIAFLSHVNSLFPSEKIKLEGMMVESNQIEVLQKPIKRVSFGIQFNTGKTHAGAHETPFVSPDFTRIEGGKSFGYGFFGQINFNKRHSIRPSFVYSKNEHFHFVEDLRFASAVTDLNLELYSHELKFGLDYAFSVVPDFKLFDVKVGAGISYHKVISLESNNYMTNFELEVKDINELDLAPLSYKFFMALEVGVFNSMVVGVEPYIIYQKRLARYTPSTFIADQGNFPLLSGLNLTLRF